MNMKIEKFFNIMTFILCLLFIFLIFSTDKVNAQTTTYTLNSANYQDVWTTSNTPGWVWSGTNAPLRNISAEGQILFNLSIEGKFKIYDITIKTNNINYACNYNSIVIYNDNTKQVQSLSVVCPTGWTGSSGVTEIRLGGESWQNNNIFRLGKYITFTDFGSDSDYGTVLGNIQTNSHDIITAIGNLRGDTQAVSQAITTQSTLIIQALNTQNTSLITQIQNQSTQQHQDAQQQYNFISNTNISTTTTNSVNNIDTSNSDTKLAVTNFALIPLNFMQSIVNSFSSSCSQVCIGQCGGSSGGGHDNAWRFIFPCLDIESLVGSSIYTIIDSLFAFGMIFAFIRSVRNFFINALLLTTDASSEVGVFL